MKNIFRIAPLAIALAGAGCAPLSNQPRLAASNPASPSAPEAAFPPAASLLLTGNNYAMSPAGEGQPMKMDMKKDMKMDLPAQGAKPAKTPDHEGHAKPSSPPKADEHQEHNPPKQ